ncbi:UNVERIFIED_CONTAM: hypothetical protein HDU68_012075 [Siphonaria sp. JEL0065]|nr:hypothetical protein HDU68_012075 [Siphonaria sp. JEL0065]
MKYSKQELAFGVISLAFFPASLGFVYALMENPKWCLADMCINSRDLIQTNLWIYYGFLTVAGIVALLATKLSRLNLLLSRKVASKSTISLGELGFSLLMLMMLLSAGSWNYKYFHERRQAKWFQRNRPLSGLIFNTLYNVSGDLCAIMMGLVMIPVAKNSFLATFLNLPYTSLRSAREIADYYFKYEPGHPWGHHEYIMIVGFVAILALTFVVMTSLDYVRRRWYNTFFYTHFFVFIFILFAYFHASSCIYFALPGLLMYTVDGFIRLRNRFQLDKVSAVIFEDSGYITVTVQTTKAARAAPGQFMRVCFPKLCNEFHPWSIVESTETNTTFMFVKSAKPDEWSTRVAEYLRQQKEHGMAGDVMVSLQGPYGKEIDVVKRIPDVFVCFVGGTGVAACVSAVKWVLFNATSEKETKVFLFWSSRSHNLDSLSHLKGLLAMSADCLHIQLFETGNEWATSDLGTAGGTPSLYDGKRELTLTLMETHSKKRADLNHLLQKFVAPLDVFETVFEVGVFVCGPKSLSLDALAACDTFQKEHAGFRVAVEVESFYL